MMKKNNLKKIVSVFIAAMLLLSCSACLFITNAGAVTPRWVGILSIDLIMGFDGNEGTVSGAASKQSTASKIEGTIYVYKLVGDDWIYVDEWYNSKNRGTLAGGGRLWAILPVRAELHTKRSLSLRRISGPLRKRRQMNISYNVLDIKKKVVFISV